MYVSKQQKVILQAAMMAPGAFKPKYIVEKTGLAYNIVSRQLERLVDKKILVKDKETKTYTVAEGARKQRTTPFTEHKKQVVLATSQRDGGNETRTAQPAIPEALSPRAFQRAW